MPAEIRNTLGYVAKISGFIASSRDEWTNIGMNGKTLPEFFVQNCLDKKKCLLIFVTLFENGNNIKLTNLKLKKQS